MHTHKPAAKPGGYAFIYWAVAITLGLGAGYYLATAMQPPERNVNQPPAARAPVTAPPVETVSTPTVISPAAKPADTPVNAVTPKKQASNAIPSNSGSTRLKGKLKTPSDDYEFDRIVGNAIGEAKLMVSSYGATYTMSLRGIRKIDFPGRNSISFEHKNGYKETAELHCEPGDTITFYSGDEIAYYTSCETLSSVDEIEFLDD